MVLRRHIWLKLPLPGSHLGPLSSMPPLKKASSRRKWSSWIVRLPKDPPSSPGEEEHCDHDHASPLSLSPGFYSPKPGDVRGSPGTSSEASSPGTSSEPSCAAPAPGPPSSPGTSSEASSPPFPPPPPAHRQHRNYGRWYQVLSWRTGIPQHKVKALFYRSCHDGQE